MIEQLLNMMPKKKKKALLILKENSQYMFLLKSLKDLKKETEQEVQKLQERFELKVDKIWSDIIDELHKEGHITSKEVNISIEDGVVFLLEENDNGFS